jgi:N-succinyldiaminopimelate aminotransferase
VIREALAAHLDGLSTYPTTAGLPALREAIATWCAGRFSLGALDAGREVLPVNGTREALFSFAQCVVDGTRAGALVACPNPFYQIYEGAALLAGAKPVFLNQTAEHGYRLDFESLPPETWARVQLLYVCTPGNPTGRVLTLPEWQVIFEYADRFGFAIASDECYSEIYPDETAPPLGGLEAARALGRQDWRHLVVFGSLSKRSNAPGLRSGFVAGDASLLREFLRYRTYHGCAMSLAVQHASIAAWSDEGHVRENRASYRRAFDAAVPLLQPRLDVRAPEAGFYLWAGTPGDDVVWARELFGRTHVTVLPGQYLAREAHGRNPGAGRVRMALVAPLEACVDAARRIASPAVSRKP